MTENKFELSILVGPSIQQWQLDALKRTVETTPATVSTVVVDNSESEGITDALGRLVDLGLWGGYLAWQRVRQRIRGSKPSYRVIHPIDSVPGYADTTVHHCTPISDGIWNALPPESVELLSRTDCAVRFGFGLLKGDVLTAPSEGVLSYHHGLLGEYRGQPAGFWEFMNGESTGGVTIQRLTESIDAGKIVAETRVDISDHQTWQSVQKSLFSASPALLPKAVRCLNSPENDLTDAETLGTVNTTPTARETVAFIRRNLRGAISHRYENIIN